MPQPFLPPPSPTPMLRSFNSQQRMQAIFYNRTPRHVAPLWLDFQGDLQPYPTMPPYTGRRMITYVGHIWIFREVSTDDRLTANGSELYSAEPTEDEQPEIVNIYLEVYTLKERCLQTIRKLVQPCDWKKLEIAHSLHEDLENRPKAGCDVRRMAIRFWEQTRSGPR